MISSTDSISSTWFGLGFGFGLDPNPNPNPHLEIERRIGGWTEHVQQERGDAQHGDGDVGAIGALAAEVGAALHEDGHRDLQQHEERQHAVEQDEHPKLHGVVAEWVVGLDGDPHQQAHRQGEGDDVADGVCVAATGKQTVRSASLGVVGAVAGAQARLYLTRLA